MVDRSYTSYGYIRNYHDTGIIKWVAFTTGVLVEAQKKFTKAQLIKDSIDKRNRDSYDKE